MLSSNFFFAKCHEVCPVVVASLAKVQDNGLDLNNLNKRCRGKVWNIP
jgi:cytochrome oxidase Cu insertion factor (SCO1/SenC/PrrC family)